MTVESDAFEALNARIRTLVDGKSATVTWNATIPDPDDPRVSRQIDVLIEEGGRRTAVECRERDAAQSVMWVEELIGRKMSLGLDGMIGVAISGFSALAVVKAKRYGIALHDFHSLSDAEISSWGGVARVEAVFIQFDPLLVTAGIDSGQRQNVTLEPVFQCDGKDGYAVVMQMIRDNAAAKANTQQIELLDAKGFEVDGIPVSILTVGYQARLVSSAAACTAIQAVDRPGTPVLIRSVTVQRFDHTAPEIVLHADRSHVLLNVSTLTSPEDSLLHEIKIRYPGPVAETDYELIGEKTINTQGRRTVLQVVAI